MSTRPNTTDLDRLEALAKVPMRAATAMEAAKGLTALHDAATPAAILELIQLARRSQPVAATQQAAREQQEPVAWTTRANIEAFTRGKNSTLVAWRSNIVLGDFPLYAAPVAQQSEAGVCQVPPEGWSCTRASGHEGPCAASPVCITCGCLPCGCSGNAKPVEAGAPTAAASEVLDMVLDVVRLAHDAMDGTEENEHGLMWDQGCFDALSAAMDKLDELPDDQPGYTMGPAAKVRWAMRIAPTSGRESAAPVAKCLFRTDDFGEQWEVTPEQAAQIDAAMQKGAQG